MKTIDIHCHVVPSGFPAAPCSCVADVWPSVDHRGEQQSAVMVGQREFRVIDSRCWDVVRRTADMDAEDVTIQALSPMPELLSYWIEPKAALTLSRHVNGAIAGMVRAAPQRFVGLGMVPLQDPELAAKELAALKGELGLIGVEVGSNINGKSPGDPSFDVFYAEAERLGLALFIHALKPAATDRIVGPQRLAGLISFPLDVGLAAASMITGRVAEKFPKLRIAFSHGGGTFASVLPRLQDGWNKLKIMQSEFHDPTATARKFFYDNIVFDSKLLRYVIDTFGATQVCVGSDYPFKGGQKRSAATFDALGMSGPEIANLRGGNATRFLALPA